MVLLLQCGLAVYNFGLFLTMLVVGFSELNFYQDDIRSINLVGLVLCFNEAMSGAVSFLDARYLPSQVTEELISSRLPRLTGRSSRSLSILSREGGKFVKGKILVDRIFKRFEESLTPGMVLDR